MTNNEPRALRPHAGVEHRPQLRLAVESGPVLSMQLHKLSCNSDGFRLRVRLHDRPATYNFLGLGKGSVCHSDLAVGSRPARSSALCHHASTCGSESHRCSGGKSDLLRARNEIMFVVPCNAKKHSRNGRPRNLSPLSDDWRDLKCDDHFWPRAAVRLTPGGVECLSRR